MTLAARLESAQGISRAPGAVPRALGVLFRAQLRRDAGRRELADFVRGPDNGDGQAIAVLA